MGLFRHFFKPLDRPAFIQAMASALARQNSAEPVTVEAEDFVIKLGAGRSIHLGNLYEEYVRAGPFKRAQIFDFTVAHAQSFAPEVPAGFAAARRSLMPSVRDPLLFDLQRRLSAPAPDSGPQYDPAYELLADDYSVSVVFDGPATLSYLNKEQFRAWDVPFERALEYAVDNLAARPARVRRVQNGLYAFETGDSYDAARLLLRERIRALELRGRPVAAIPNRECLLVTGEEDAKGLAGLASLVEKRFDHPRAIGVAPLVLEGDRWRTFRPEGKDALAVRLRNLVKRNLGTRYADQKRALDRSQAGSEFFVASLSGMSLPGSEEIHSLCLWSRGVPLLLPKSDFIIFAGEGQADERLYPWEAVMGELGDRMKPQGMLPERWAVSEFPPSEQLGRISGCRL